MKGLICILFLLTASVCQSQQSTVMVTNSPDGKGTDVRFFVQGLFIEEGVNVYRRESNTGEWQRLNTVPVKKGGVITQDEFDADRELKSYTDALQRAKPGELEGLAQIFLLVKAIQSEPLARHLGVHYDDETAEGDKTYRYKIQRVNGDGEVLAGESDSITVGPFFPGAPPEGFEINASETQSSLRWKVEESRYYAVNVYRSTMENNKLLLLTTQPLMLTKAKNEKGESTYPDYFFVEKNLAPGVYFYEIAGIDFFGRETRHTEKIRVEIRDTTPPPAPEKPTIRIDHAKLRIDLGWKAVSSADLRGYHVYRSAKSDSGFVRVNTQIIPVNAVAFSQRIEKARKYYYRVVSVDAAGNESSAVTVFADVHDVIPPLAPRNVHVQSDTGKIVLIWEANTEKDLRGYYVYRATNSKRHFVLLNATPIETSTFEDKLPENIRNTFSYRVVAADSSFNKSEASGIASVKLPDVMAPAPPFIKQVVTSEGALTITWLPAIDRDAKNFKLFRSTGGNIILLATLSSIEASFEDDKVVSDQSYKYHLTLVDSAGNESEKSNEFAGRWVKRAASLLIGGVTASYDSISGNISVGWLALSSASVGYILYRKKGEEEFKPIGPMLTEHHYIDTRAQKGEVYAYRVKAYGEKGVVAESTDYSIEIKK